MRKNKFWNFAAAEQGRNATLTIYGDVSDVSWWGDEVTPKQFQKELEAVQGDIDICINSGGGDVFAGMAIYSMLKRHEGHKTVYIDGLAASIASVIAMAGDTIIMPENAMMMIHNAWSCAGGDKAKLRKIADELEKIDGMIAGVYAARGTRDAEDYAAMMENETWFTAQEAMEAGLIDSIGEAINIAASIDGDTLCTAGLQFDMSRYAHAERLREIVQKNAQDDHSNGGESQPVDDNTTPDALAEQRRQFGQTRRKIIERIESE